MNLLTAHLLNNPNTDPSVIVELLNDQDKNVVYKALEHPNLPYETMQTLALTGNDLIAYHIAKNPSIPENVAYLLLDRGQIETLVENPYVSPYFLEQIFTFGLEDLYGRLAQNEGISSQLQQNLFTEHKWNKNLAMNNNLTEDIIKRLIDTNDVEVLQALTQNKRLTSIHIDIILKKQNDIINYFITSMSESPEVYELAIKNNVKLVKTLLKNPQTSYTTVDMLTKCKNTTVNSLAEEYRPSLLEKETRIPTEWL